MALRVPVISLPAGGNFGAATAVAGTATMKNTELMALPQGPIAAGNSFDTDPVLVAGYNSFGFVTTFTGGGTLTLSYNICDPRTFAIQLTRQIAAGLTTDLFQVFGAFAAVGAADPFLVISIHFAAVTAAITIQGVNFFMATR
jgi:hypothetical protein